MVKLRIFILLLALAAPAAAQTAPVWEPIADNTTFTTGDTWTVNGTTYRLYGVQACLRNSFFTNHAGERRDCGEASMFMLASLIKDLQPLCYAVAQTRDGKTKFVICSAKLRKCVNAGKILDLGTALIASGFAFAALKPDGQAVNPTYYVSQTMAQEKRKGLWSFNDVPDPNAIILQSLPKPAQ
jgi:endonuclease YncB( thermonuclease family)